MSPAFFGQVQSALLLKGVCWKTLNEKYRFLQLEQQAQFSRFFPATIGEKSFAGVIPLTERVPIGSDQKWALFQQTCKRRVKNADWK